jgi:hypothetical protein
VTGAFASTGPRIARLKHERSPAKFVKAEIARWSPILKAAGGPVN